MQFRATSEERVMKIYLAGPLGFSDECDAVVAILDGVDVDSGTAAEIGYAFAKGRPIFGYRGDFRLSADNEGATVNLQVEYFIRQSGGDIVTTIEQLPGALEKIKAAVQKRRG
jgi:nucleoside 2-deoxyribosyltransferase